MTTTRPYELLARFGKDGWVYGAHVRTITTIDGRDFEGDPQPLSGVSDPAFVAFANQFAASVTAERDSLKSQLEAKTQEASTLATERDSLQGQFDAANASLAEKTNELAAANEAIAAKDARITQLLEAIPYNPRVMEASAFIGRISSLELVQLFDSDDQVTQSIATLLKTYKANDWPIVLDSPEIQQAVPYLISTGLLSEQRAAELLRDCSRSEAYVADQST